MTQGFPERRSKLSRSGTGQEPTGSELMGGDRARYADRDSTTGGEAPKITSPTISEMLAAYLADEKARLAAKTYGLYADVIELLQHSLSRQGGHYLQ